MSLIINDRSLSISHFPESDSVDMCDEMASLNRYLSIIETNRQSSHFVPDDALVALDMAGFVKKCLNGEQCAARISAARMALALVQPCRRVPTQ